MIFTNVNNRKNNSWISKLWNYFTLYEKIWFGSLLILTLFLAIFMPEEDGITEGTGIIITILIFFEVTIGLMCELLNAKQNRWGCLIYVTVELITIAECLLASVRFVTIAIALFVWIPIHITSFITWNKNIDKEDNTKTIVRRLKPWQAALLVVCLIIGTIIVGYFTASIFADISEYPDGLTGTMCFYIDASLGILGIIDGLLLIFRFKEAWYIWYVYIGAEIAINILLGRWTSLVYDLGYLTNTTYGLILWNKYIKKHETSITF